ncbi:M14 family zinc carboxypeptidase [Paenibacillus sp. GCM10027627]|uniref:M14 family zinc carboxypeptidase n=1 Tax=unclassified Paenibacillus TaxID=185978 RepID=UPI0036306B9D
MQITVRPGDTLWGYSILFGVPFPLIADSNPGINANTLTVGQQMQIPGYVWADYTVKAGDSVWRIAKANGISPDLLIRSNPGLQLHSLQIGANIRVPQRIETLVVQTDRIYGYKALQEDLERLLGIYPFLQRRSIGNSVMGKAIPEIRIGRGPGIVHFNAAIHANEWITAPLLVRFMNEYALALTNSLDLKGEPSYPLYFDAVLSIVPMLNPDGVELVAEGLPREEPYRQNVLDINDGSTDFNGWKANIRGVDLNKQFPALWERDAVNGPQEPSPRDYSGSAPLTEPEVQALAKLTRESSFLRVLAFHTQGEVIFWGFEGLEPPESENLANELSNASGYRAVRYVDSTAGYKDWFIQNWRRPGFTVEFGLGVNPLPLGQLNDMYEAALSIILTAISK